MSFVGKKQKQNKEKTKNKKQNKTTKTEKKKPFIILFISQWKQHRGIGESDGTLVLTFLSFFLSSTSKACKTGLENIRLMAT